MRTSLNRLIRPEPRARTLPRYEVSRDTGCWLWQGHQDRDGYGRIKEVLFRDERAHRAYYTLLVGPIDDGKHLHHKCENKACVNPNHLEQISVEAHNTLHFRGKILGRRRRRRV
jgi:hypothetical protein